MKNKSNILAVTVSGKSVDFEFEYGGDYLWANCEVSYSIDHNYGADSDGTRSIERLFIEEVQILRVEDLSGETIETDDAMVELISDIAANLVKNG